MEEIDLACQEAVNGVPSKRPIIEMTIPSVLDKTISPPGIYKFTFGLYSFNPYKFVFAFFLPSKLSMLFLLLILSHISSSTMSILFSC